MHFNKVCWILQAVGYLLAAAQALGSIHVDFRRVTSSGLPMGDAAAILENVRTSLECARMCHRNVRSACCSFGYNMKSRQCRLYAESYSDVDEVDFFDYFVGCPAIPVTSAIWTGNVSATPACTNGTGYTYDKLVGYKLHPYNLKYYNGTSEDQCKTLCSADYLCKSFDWNPGNYCYLKNVSKEEVPANLFNTSSWNHYEKRCA